MRSLRWVVLIAVVCAGMEALAPSLPAQVRAAPKLKAEPKSLDDRMVWLRESIARTAGFALTTPGGAMPQRLSYEFHGQEMCQLSWRPVTAGDAELLRDYPGVEQVEDLKGIVPESVRVLPVDVRGLLAGGTGQAAEGEADIFWKITASYMDGRRLPEEPFGFVFADMQTAQRVAAVLTHGAGECQGATTLEQENDVGCDDAPALKVNAPVPSAKNAGHLESQGNFFLPGGKVYSGPRVLMGEFVNRGSMAVSCVFETGYYQLATPHAWVRNQYVRLDLPPGPAWGEIDFPEFLDALPGGPTHMECYRQGAVNAVAHVCADLHHPVHLNLRNEPVKP